MLLDHLYQWVSKLENPLLSGLLGGANLAYSATFDQAESQRTISRIEHAAFGSRGLAGAEAALGPHALGVLASRSYAQQLGRVYTLRYPLAGVVQWILHLGLLVPLVPYLLLKGAVKVAQAGAQPGSQVVLGGTEGARKLFDMESNAVPMAFCPAPGEGLQPKDLAFALRAVRACPRLLLAPPLLTNLLRWLSKYAWVVRAYQPSAIITFAEGTPASSLLTAYLREKGIRHVNHMHGERFPNPAQAFCCFDATHLWGEAFRELFESQLWRMGEVEVAGTAFHHNLFEVVRAKPGLARTALVIHSQFLTPGTLPFESLTAVLAAMGPGWTIHFRPHYLALSHAETCFKTLSTRLPGHDLVWHDPRERPLQDALGTASLVVGPYSTAMLEAWIAGRKLIHLPTEMKPEAVLARYGGSPNVVYAGPVESILPFADAPVCDDLEERRRVNHLVAVLNP